LESKPNPRLVASRPFESKPNPRLVRFQELSLDLDPIKKTGDYYFLESDLTPTYYHKPGLGYLNVQIFELELVAFGPVELSSLQLSFSFSYEPFELIFSHYRSKPILRFFFLRHSSRFP
jgi:hypothetical protein